MKYIEATMYFFGLTLFYIVIAPVRAFFATSEIMHENQNQ